MRDWGMGIAPDMLSKIFELFHLARLADRPERRETAHSRRVEGARPSGLHLLVVDDNRDAADSLSILPRLRGHRSSVARDGGSAVERALSESPDVVLLDLGLPGVDGFEVCRILRERSLTRARIIAITGYARDEDRRRSLEAGFDGHLVKPVDPEALLALLAEPRV
ncbi:MAG: response regulator [Myxococcota bacterium]